MLDGRVHKLEQVRFDYDSGGLHAALEIHRCARPPGPGFLPFKDRTAKTNLGVIYSQVHQMFGRYQGFAIADDGERIEIEALYRLRRGAPGAVVRKQ